NLSFLSADVSIIGHHKFLPWLGLRYGGGLGLGWVAGDVLLTNNGPMCSAANAKDPTQCYPLNTGPINGKPTPAQEASLKASEGNGTDTNVSPHRHVTGDKPPVMAVLNVLVGLRFYPIPRLALTVEIGLKLARIDAERGGGLDGARRLQRGAGVERERALGQRRQAGARLRPRRLVRRAAHGVAIDDERAVGGEGLEHQVQQLHVARDFGAQFLARHA